MKTGVVTFLFLILLISGCANNDEMNLIRERIVAELLTRPINSEHINKLMQGLNEEGKWSYINYEDVSRTAFMNSVHLRNMVLLSEAYANENSPFYKDQEVLKSINSALKYWADHDFICENWWWNEIGTPMNLTNVLLLAGSDIDKDLIQKIYKINERCTFDASGARPSGDRIKIGGIYAKNAILQNNEPLLKEITKEIDSEIKFAEGRGMQVDYSFHHREDRVNNTVTYGLDYADAFAEWAYYLAGTSYQLSEKSVKHLIDYYLDGICKMAVYGKYRDAGVANRENSRSSYGPIYSALTPQRLLSASDYRSDELKEIIALRSGEEQTPRSFSKFFWQTEHYVHQRPHYYTSVRMFSTRNHNMEVPYNGEGLKNHYRADGTSYLSVTGKEYSLISPVYDWQKIPGTTIMRRKEMPGENEVQKAGTMDFVGAATDGLYGVVGFDFSSSHDPVKARKAWFFFDDEYVCLGTNIVSDGSDPVHTTIDQSYQEGAIFVRANNNVHELNEGSHFFKSPQWIFHDNKGYVLMQPSLLHVQSGEVSGTWKNVNRQTSSSANIVTKDIFKAWLDHGTDVKSGEYAYMIIPAIDRETMENRYKNNPVRVLSNSADQQVVTHTSLGLTQAVLYEPGDIILGNGRKISSHTAGIIMIREKENEITEITVSDPTRKLKAISLIVNSSVSQSIKSIIEEENLTITLPLEAYAGSSITIK